MVMYFKLLIIKTISLVEIHFENSQMHVITMSVKVYCIGFGIFNFFKIHLSGKHRSIRMNDSWPDRFVDET